MRANVVIPDSLGRWEGRVHKATRIAEEHQGFSIEGILLLCLWF